MKHFSFALIFYLLLSLPSFAQVQVNWPEDGLVFQRNKPSSSLTTQVYFVISSTNGTPITSAAVQFQPIALNGSVGNAVDPSSGAVTNAYTGLTVVSGMNTCQVRGYFNIRAGMYRVTPRLNSTSGSAMTIGVGEVLAIAGQSNAAGYAKNGNAATAYSNAAYVRYNNKKDQRDGDDPGGPDAGGSATNDFIWYWGRVGQKLVDYFSLNEGRNVPVAFYQAAWSGSGAEDWWATILAGGTSTRYTGTHAGYPGKNLRAIIDNNLSSYMKKVGIRGILWHQGEYDNLVQKTNYDTYLNELIIRSRNSVSGESNLAWVIARASYVNGSVDTRSPSIVDAQNQVIGNKSGGGVKLFGDPFGSGNGSEKNYRYTGPFTDDLTGSAYRISEPVIGYTHFNAAGQIAVADKWVEALTQTNGGNNFFNSSLPVINNPATAVATGGICDPVQQPCQCGFTLEGASQVSGQYKVNFIFNSCNASELGWSIFPSSDPNGVGAPAASGTLFPTSGSITVDVPATITTGSYFIKVKALNCIGSSQWTFNYTKPGGGDPPAQLCQTIPTQNSGNASEYADYTLTPSTTGGHTFVLTYASGEADPGGTITVAGASYSFSMLSTSSWTPGPTAVIRTQSLTAGTSYTIRIAGRNGPPSHTFAHNKLCINPTGARTGVEEAQVTVKPEVDESEIFTVFPNPTSGSIKVKYYTENERSVTIKLFDVSGRVLKEIKAQSVKGINENELNITDLSDAPYILNLNDGQKEHSKQIIKIK